MASQHDRNRTYESDISIFESVNAGKAKLDLRNGRYRCKLFVGERAICSVQEWNRIDVERAAAGEAIRLMLGHRKFRLRDFLSSIFLESFDQTEVNTSWDRLLWASQAGGQSSC